MNEYLINSLALLAFALAFMVINLQAGANTLKVLTYWLMVIALGGSVAFLVAWLLR